MLTSTPALARGREQPVRVARIDREVQEKAAAEVRTKVREVQRVLRRAHQPAADHEGVQRAVRRHLNEADGCSLNAAASKSSPHPC